MYLLVNRTNSADTIRFNKVKKKKEILPDYVVWKKKRNFTFPGHSNRSTVFLSSPLPANMSIKIPFQILYVSGFVGGGGMRYCWGKWDRRTWPSGQRVGLAIRRSRVRVPLWPLAGFVLGRPEFKFSATLVYSQLVAFCQLGFLIQLFCIWIICF